MKKKRRITPKVFIFTAVTGGILIILVLVFSTLWTSRRTESATNEAVSAVSEFYLEAMADRRARTITNLINSNFEQMEKAMLFVGDENIKTQDDMRRSIGRIKSLLSLNRFAIVDCDNIVYTQYTTYTGGSRHAFLADDTMEDRNISTVSVYGSSRQICLAAPTPGLRLMGKDMKACFVQIDIKEIVDLLAFDDQGRTYFGLYSSSGESLSGTELGTHIADKNLFESLKGVVTEEEWKENHENFAKGLKGSIRFTIDGAEETICYVPVEGTDTQMAVLIRESVISDTIHDISEKNMTASRNLIISILVLLLLFAILLFIEFEVMSRHKLEDERENSRRFHSMANTDSLTGIRNKHAYSFNESELNKKIKNNELTKLALIVCDVNGLKLVNDTQGHAAGDKLIKDASRMLCENFNHGAVFRIGGDEFVVILQEKGFDTMDETIAAFNSKVEEHIKTKEVVVAIGYSVLNENDERLRDVFERADHMMYIRKKQLKEMGAPSRAE